MANPWLETNLEKFLFYCCPECDMKKPGKAEFLLHAVRQHPNARVVYKAIELKKTPAGKTRSVPIHPEKPPVKKVSKLQEVAVGNINKDLGSKVIDLPEKSLVYAMKIETQVQPEPDLEFVDEALDDFDEDDDQDDDGLTTLRSIQKTYNRGLKKLISEDSKKCEQVQCYYCCCLVLEDLISDHTSKVHGQEATLNYGPKKKYQCVQCKGAMDAIASDSSEHVCHQFPILKQDVKIQSLPSRKAMKRRNLEQISPSVPKVSKPDIISERINPEYVSTVGRFANVKIDCKLCPEEFPSKKKWAIHMKMIHQVAEPYQCLECDKSFKGTSNLKNHVKLVHLNQKDHVCELCGQAFFDVTKLRVHKERHHKLDANGQAIPPKKHKTRLPDDREMTCELCHSAFIGESALNAHKNLTHGIDMKRLKMSPCDICGKLVNKSAICMKNHKKKYHPTPADIAKVVPACSNCKMVAGNALELNDHQKTCLSADDLKHFNCPNCSIGPWHSTKALQRHFAEVHKNLFDICPVAGCALKHYGNKTQVQNHVDFVHYKKKGTYECPYCSKTYANGQSLRHHVTVNHERDKMRYKCTKCDMRYPNPERLAAHDNAVHTKSIVYHCPKCDFKSYRKGGVYNHNLMVHEKHRPYSCDICQSTFQCKKDRRKHYLSVHNLEIHD